MASSGSPSTVVLFGATGYVGGGILHHLLTQPLVTTSKASNHDAISHKPLSITAVTGSPSKTGPIKAWFAYLQSAGVVRKGISLDVQSADRSGSQSEGTSLYELASRLSAQADLVIQAATSDDLKLTQSINEGLTAARSQGKKQGGLIHFSGVQLIESEPVGEYVDVKEYDDLDLKALEDIPDSAAHRQIDLDIVNRVSKGDFYGSIICPALIWGVAMGPCKRVSAMLPDMVSKALYNGRNAVHCGKGDNVWTNVHVDDVVDLTSALVAHHLTVGAPASPPPAHSTFYFTSHKELNNFKDLAAAIGSGLHDLGLLPSSSPKSVPVPNFDKAQKGVRIEDDARGESQEEKQAPIWPTRTNVKCVSNRGQQQFGWVAKRRFDGGAQRDDAIETVRVFKAEGQLAGMMAA